MTSPALHDGSTMKIGGRYLIRTTAQRLFDVWCNEISPGGHVRLKRCADRQSEWHAALAVNVVEILAEPPACTSCGKHNPLAHVDRDGATCVGCLRSRLEAAEART